MSKVSLPKGFALWGESLQEKWLKDNPTADARFTPCECGHSRAGHINSRGACLGTCRCSRFVKRTREFIHVNMMRDALLAAIEVIESLPGAGRTVKVGLPSQEEQTLIIKQMKAAIAGPKIEVAA